jgi:hypothetical protein
MATTTAPKTVYAGEKKKSAPPKKKKKYKVNKTLFSKDKGTMIGGG